jgi:hypothetical protein
VSLAIAPLVGNALQVTSGPLPQMALESATEPAGAYISTLPPGDTQR